MKGDAFVRRPETVPIAKRLARENPQWPRHKALTEAKRPATEQERYLQFDPFEGDRDVSIRARTVKIVTTAKPHPCAMTLGIGVTPHEIPAKSRARFEAAIVDGEWRACYACLPCIDAWLAEYRSL